MKAIMKRSTAIIMMVLLALIPTHGMHLLRCTRVKTARHTPRTYSQLSPVLAHAHSNKPLLMHDLVSVTAMTDSYFDTVPGYKQLKKQLYSSLESPKHYTTKGYLYELQVALYLVDVEQDTIHGFERKFVHPTYQYIREIDIITDRCAIECKNINWNVVQHLEYIAASLASQFSDQAELVHAGVVGVPHFMVCSKNQIPFEWKVWFWERSILYMEGPY